MRVVGFERFTTATDEESGSPWIIPSRHSAEDLAEYKELINKMEFDPLVFEDGDTAEQQVRRKTAPRKKAVYDDDEDGELDDLIDDDALFPKNLPNKKLVGPDSDRPQKKRRVRRRKDKSGSGSEGNELLSDDDADERRTEKARKRRERELEKQRKIKSALYVNSEDDRSDAEGDAEFFAREEAIRQRVKKALQFAPTDASELLQQQAETNSTAIEATLKRLMAGSDAGESGGEDDDAPSTQNSTKQLASRKRKIFGSDSEDDDEETSPPPAKKAAVASNAQPKKKKSKMGFVVDTSDEEDEDQDMDDAEATDKDEEMETNDTPLSSNPKNTTSDQDDEDVADKGRSPLREKSVNGTAAPTHDNDDEEADDDDDVLPAATAAAKRRSRMRAGFIDDSDDE